MTRIRRVALVGFGAIAENAYLPALGALGVSIKAIAEISPTRRAAAERLCPTARVYADQSALLLSEKDIDAVIVTTPPSTHAAAVLAGLRAGLHVLCEKPLTLDPEAAMEMAAEVDEHDRCLFSVNNWRHAPALSRLIEICGSGRLGRIRHAELRVLRTKPSVSALPGDWRKDPAIAGGGILVDHGWHALYLMRQILGPQTRLESCVLLPEGQLDEVASLLLCAPGSSGFIHLSWKASERSNAVLVLGEKGSAELRDDVLTVRAETPEEVVRFSQKLSEGSAHPEWLIAMWPEFESECFGGQRGVNFSEARFCLDTIRTAYSKREIANVR